MKKSGNGIFYLKEVLKIFRLNWVSNSISLISTALIYLILGLVITGTWMTNFIVLQLQEEAEITVYLEDAADVAQFMEVVEQVKTIKGVTEVFFIEEAMAYERMEKILGDEAGVLNYFDTNPLNGFIEVGVDIELLDLIVAEINENTSVVMIRENREIIEKITQISTALNRISFFIITAVGITTLVTLAYIIRQSIFHYREKIQTLFLLGAPTHFIAIPFYIMGTLISVIAYGFALIILLCVINQGYQVVLGPLPFIILPNQSNLVFMVSALLGTLSIVLGMLASFMGMKSVKQL
jgi:cell division transport system permease protein